MAYKGIPGPFTDQTPFIDMHFTKWADNVPERKSVSIKNYLDSLGFVIGTDKLTEEEHQRLEYAEDVWHRNSPWIRQRLNLNDLFTVVDKETVGYWYVQGLGECKFKDIKAEALITNALNESGWIYSINRQTTYFKIIDNRLYAKYQQIIGGRLIAIINKD